MDITPQALNMLRAVVQKKFPNRTITLRPPNVDDTVTAVALLEHHDPRRVAMVRELVYKWTDSVPSWKLIISGDDRPSET